MNFGRWFLCLLFKSEGDLTLTGIIFIALLQSRHKIPFSFLEIRCPPHTLRKFLHMLQVFRRMISIGANRHGCEANRQFHAEIARILNLHLPMDLPWSYDHSLTKAFIVQNRPSSMYSLEFTILLLLLEFYYGATHSSTLVPEILKKLLCVQIVKRAFLKKRQRSLSRIQKKIYGQLFHSVFSP